MQRYGFVPQRLPDFKGLIGDKSDNIPGVPGIGEKTASRLLAEYGDLEGILAHLSALKPREQKLLSGAAEQARKSKYLATIVLDVPVQLDLNACRMTHVDSDKVIALFRQLEFRSQVERVFALFRELGISVSSSAGSDGAATLFSESATDARTNNGSRDYNGSSVAEGGENPLYAPPSGVVPIVMPPLPPGEEAVVPRDVTDPATLLAPVKDATAIAPAAGTPAAVALKEEPAQLTLFEIETPQEEVVHKLHLPSNSSALSSLFVAEDASSHTSTMIVDSEESLRILLKSLQDAGRFALDTETSSEDPRHAELVGISLSMAPGEAYYIPVGHIHTPDGQEPGAQLPLAYVIEKLKPVLEDETILKYMHNAKYDLAILLRYGVDVQGLAFDSMLGAYLAEPGRRGVGLKDQAFQRLGIMMTPISDLIGSGSKMISMAQVPIRRAADYAGADADMTFRLVEPIQEELRKHGLLDMYQRIELPLIPVLMQMELYGVALDAQFLQEFNVRLEEQLEALVEEIYASVGHRFNINSTKQLADVLFVELKLPTGKKTKTGYSVSADVIEGLRGRHPVVDYLLEYRQLNKLKSTYVDGLLALMDPYTGRVYTSFNQTVASSGRLSSSNPNLQNIPVRTELGRQIRRAFIADPSYVLLTADYSQFELRILAHITHEPRLVDAFTKGEDIHTITASTLFGVPTEQVTKDQRRLAKTVVYAVLYGQSAYGLANVTGMSNAESAEFIKHYHETFPNVKVYVDSTLQQARTQGYVNTLYGRKRFFPDMHSLSHTERQALEREAINMPIQGTNADLIKIAMIRLHHALKEKRMKTRMILQVHDELAFEVPVEELERARALIRSMMEGVADLDVPIRVEMKMGKNWYEAEPME
jgi:DNA polymerase-1